MARILRGEIRRANLNPVQGREQAGRRPVLIPNKLTVKTLKKSQRGEDVDTFDSLEEMLESWEQ